MLNKIKCFLGIHKWNNKDGFYFEVNNNFRRRICKYCGKVQENSYDMSYGETIWNDRTNNKNL